MNVDRGDDYYNPVGRNNQVGEIINDMSEQDGVRLLSYALSTSEYAHKYFNQLDPADVLHMSQLMNNLNVEKSEKVMQYGETATFFCFITEGHCEAITLEGHSYKIKKGDILGEMGLTVSSRRSADVVVMSEKASVAVMSYQVLMDLRKTDARLWQKMMRLMASISLERKQANQKSIDAGKALKVYSDDDIDEEEQAIIANLKLQPLGDVKEALFSRRKESKKNVRTMSWNQLVRARRVVAFEEPLAQRVALKPAKGTMKPVSGGRKGSISVIVSSGDPTTAPASAVNETDGSNSGPGSPIPMMMSPRFSLSDAGGGATPRGQQVYHGSSRPGSPRSQRSSITRSSIPYLYFEGKVSKPNAATNASDVMYPERGFNSSADIYVPHPVLQRANVKTKKKAQGGVGLPEGTRVMCASRIDIYRADCRYDSPWSGFPEHGPVAKKYGEEDLTEQGGWMRKRQGRRDITDDDVCVVQELAHFKAGLPHLFRGPGPHREGQD